MVKRTVIEGVGELRKQFEAIADNQKINMGRRMVASAGGVLRKEAKALAQGHGLKRSGALIKNVAIKREKSAPPGVVQYHLGVRNGPDLGRKAQKVLVVKENGRIGSKYVDNPFYWRFLEFDTKRRKGTSFIAQALANKRDEAVAAMERPIMADLKKRQNAK